MKKPPYHEIINIKEERKEYARLCNGKSKKFTLYTEWENHIKELLSDFSTPQDLYNFKHYCMNANRAQEKAPDMHLAYIGLLIPLYLDTIWDQMPAMLTLTLVVILLVFVIMQNKKLAKESCFFKDIIDIIEKMDGENVCSASLTVAICDSDLEKPKP